MDTKICSKCGELKPTTSFYKRSDRASGYKSECKKCNNSYEKIVNRESQAIRARKSWLKTSYGMTLEDYDDQKIIRHAHSDRTLLFRSMGTNLPFLPFATDHEYWAYNRFVVNGIPTDADGETTAIEWCNYVHSSFYTI